MGRFTPISILSFLLVVGGAVHAETLRVPAQHDTIGGALVAASAGDTVLVAPGTYRENLIWPDRDGIRLIAERGPEWTIIDGGSSGTVIWFDTGLTRATVLQGFTITGGRLDGSVNQGRNYGAGLLVASSPTIRLNDIRGNVCDGPLWNYGAGIHVLVSPVSGQIVSPLIELNRVRENICISGTWNFGAGIYVDREGTPDILGNEIKGNHNVGGTWGYGAGIYWDGGASPTIVSNLICENSNGSDNRNCGGGIYGGLVSPWMPTPNANVVNNTVVRNACLPATGSPDGGGIFYGSTGGMICNNIVSYNDPGGIVAYGRAAPVLEHNNSWGNVRRDYGGLAPGPSNLSLDPLFAGAEDYHLTRHSPCLDAGSNAYVPSQASQDFDADSRQQDGNLDGLGGNGAAVDIGGDELSSMRLTVSGPSALGTTVVLHTTSSTDLRFTYVLGMGAPEASWLPEPFGLALINPQEVLGMGVTPGSDSFALPASPQMAGFTLYFQSFATRGSVGNVSGRLELTLF